jgi:oligoendopeptidase F
MNKTTNREEKINLLEQSIVQLIGSFYRQSQFADFEYQARTMVEKGEGLNAGTLKSISAGISKSYYGNVVADNPYRDIIWAQVMHFYQMKYYVYQYATSYAAAAHLEQKITSGTAKEKEEALQKYLTLLKSGGNDHPIELLKKAGVDMTNPEVIKSVVTRLNHLLDQLETELKAAGKI